MEVGIDRVLTFTYSGEEDIHAYRRIPQEGAPPDDIRPSMEEDDGTRYGDQAAYQGPSEWESS